MTVEAKGFGKLFEVAYHPMGGRENLLASLDRRTVGPIKDEYRLHTYCKQSRKLVEERLELNVLPRLCMPSPSKVLLDLFDPDTVKANMISIYPW